MFNEYRTAFQSKSQNEALEHNLDKVVNLTSQKLKEMITKKQDKMRENGLLKAQKSVMESDIAYFEKETKEREEQINRLVDEFDKTGKDIEELEKEYKLVLDEYNLQNENYKLTVNSVNQDLDQMTVSNGIEETIKKSDTKIEYESYMKIKGDNKMLMEKMHESRTELYYLEVIIMFEFCIFFRFF
jgi:Mor family transcriptional regulator